MNTLFEVLDIQTRKVIVSYPTARQARRRRDQLDKAYGAVRYVVREVAA